ncbi:protein kinase family protein [Nocardiopsaceae bacterium YIM 96095]|uniref:F5/8 type C domain-containing protein n=2 Tax=Halostreptopolyspora alba TaxID=2487137 RepID=A0A3N0E5S5_9ACTN|nr:hypothetical protein EFW17_16970 [Nocardiopsaceae bacterium YIM 96095]
MSTFMIEPGTRLAGRYRLEEPVSDAGGATFWKATDETLARPVAVWTFADGFPRTAEVVRASRVTSRVSDSRVTQVFDADDSGPTPYVVEEWVVGQSLAELLAEGPLQPERAAGLVAEAAEAVAAANETGLFHLYLTPTKLMWSLGGAVKVTGIGVEAALRGVSAPNPAAADAQGLGKLLYAALTAHWPDSQQSGLPAAPTEAGRPCRPGSIRPDIPPKIEATACAAVFQDGSSAPPLVSARDIANALADVPRVVPLPGAPVHSAAPRPGTSRRSGAQGIVTPAEPSRSRGSRPSRSKTPGATRVRWALMGTAGALVLAAAMVGAWTLGSSIGGPDDSEATDAGSQEASASGGEEEELATLEPQGVEDFDPQGDGEHGERVNEAIDGDPSTAWNTQSYDSAQFGNLKDGVGLLVDLGDPSEIHEVNLDLGDTAPADVEIRVGDEADLAALSTVGEAPQASGQVDVKLNDPSEGQYVVIWFSQLPNNGEHRGTIHEVELRGKK